MCSIDACETLRSGSLGLLNEALPDSGVSTVLPLTTVEKLRGIASFAPPATEVGTRLASCHARRVTRPPTRRIILETLLLPIVVGLHGGSPSEIC